MKNVKLLFKDSISIANPYIETNGDFKVQSSDRAGEPRFTGKMILHPAANNEETSGRNSTLTSSVLSVMQAIYESFESASKDIAPAAKPAKTAINPL
jgi:hypothetical protein